MYAPAFSPIWPSANYHSGFCIMSNFGIHDLGIRKFGIQYSAAFEISSSSPILGSVQSHSRFKCSAFSPFGFRISGFRNSAFRIRHSKIRHKFLSTLSRFVFPLPPPKKRRHIRSSSCIFFGLIEF